NLKNSALIGATTRYASRQTTLICSIVRTNAADEILASVATYCPRISDSRQSARFNAGYPLRQVTRWSVALKFVTYSSYLPIGAKSTPISSHTDPSDAGCTRTASGALARCFSSHWNRMPPPGAGSHESELAMLPMTTASDPLVAWLPFEMSMT